MIATNQNDILHRALSTGEYRQAEVAPSISPSMDIQVASNFERALYDAYGRDAGAVNALMDELKRDRGFTISQGALQALREVFSSGRASEAETKATIAEAYFTTGEILCPHTAVGVKVAREAADTAVPMVTLATAHPAKFPDAVEAAIGIRPGLPSRMADLYDRPERVTRVADDLAAIEAVIRERRAA